MNIEFFIEFIFNWVLKRINYINTIQNIKKKLNIAALIGTKSVEDSIFVG